MIAPIRTGCWSSCARAAAERLAEGELSQSDVAPLLHECTGSYLSLLADDILTHRPFSEVPEIQADDAEIQLGDCAQAAWEAAGAAAWSVWEATVKHHPWLTDPRRIEESYWEHPDHVQTYLHPLYHEDYWAYARDDQHVFGVDETRSLGLPLDDDLAFGLVVGVGQRLGKFLARRLGHDRRRGAFQCF